MQLVNKMEEKIYTISEIIDYNICPRVQINRDNAYLTQVVNYKEQFQISLIGHEGFCYFDAKSD